jgi:glycosyltransferase involved in cell wall biosynthesis
MKVLFISDNDLVSRRFNGYDYHDTLEQYNIESTMLVENKISTSDYVHSIIPNSNDFTLSIIENKLFIESDIIHLHLVHNTPFDINYLPLITRLKPTVITVHDCFFLGGHCIYHLNCEKWKTHCADCEYLNISFKIEYDDTALKYLLLKTAISNSFISAIVASEWMYNKVEQSPIWNKKNIYKLPFGINQNIFKLSNSDIAKSNLNIPSNNIVIMFRCDPGDYKGMDIILYSLKNIHNKESITLITVATEGMLPELKDFYDVREYGWITDDMFLSQLFQASDIFLMPSIQEAFGLMAVEAMSCGKMVLATRGTALESIINHPNCGIVVEHIADAYLNELQRLLDNTDEIRQRGEKSYNFAKKSYSEVSFYEGILNIYNNILKYYTSCVTESEKVSVELVISQLKKYNPISVNKYVARFIFQISMVQSQLSWTQSLLSGAQSQLSGAQLHINAIENSISWKITKPLRIIKKLITNNRIYRIVIKDKRDVVYK